MGFAVFPNEGVRQALVFTSLGCDEQLRSLRQQLSHRDG